MDRDVKLMFNQVTVLCDTQAQVNFVISINQAVNLYALAKSLGRVVFDYEGCSLSKDKQLCLDHVCLHRSVLKLSRL